MTSPAILRTFIAIPLPDSVITQLDRIQRRLQRTCPDRTIRWVNPHTIHLTLFFIGDMPETQIEGINQALATAVKTYGTFTFTVADLGAFPNLRRPNVIWVGVQDVEHKLAGLYSTVCESMEQIGFPAERRRFTPHLTIGRINRRTSRDDRTRIGNEVSRATVGLLGTVEASEIVFYRSILKHTGAEHFILEKFPLTE
jgi:2'-5' RNA ligase